MRIAIDDLCPTLSLTISGDEPWLAQIYADFPPPAGEPAPRLTGRLELRREAGGSVHVTGDVNYAPILSCSRCDREIAWPLGLAVDARFLPEATNDEPREKTLSRAELDAYFLEDGQVDLETLLNDVVQTALPTAPVPVAADGRSCRVCAADVSDERVYGAATGDEAEASPFAALKGLKLRN